MTVAVTGNTEAKSVCNFGVNLGVLWTWREFAFYMDEYLTS